MHEAVPVASSSTSIVEHCMKCAQANPEAEICSEPHRKRFAGGLCNYTLHKIAIAIFAFGAQRSG